MRVAKVGTTVAESCFLARVSPAPEPAEEGGRVVVALFVVSLAGEDTGPVLSSDAYQIRDEFLIANEAGRDSYPHPRRFRYIRLHESIMPDGLCPERPSKRRAHWKRFCIEERQSCLAPLALASAVVASALAEAAHVPASDDA